MYVHCQPVTHPNDRPLQGQESSHGKLRLQVVQHIEEERELYEPFIEDNEPFLKYCSRMRQASLPDLGDSTSTVSVSVQQMNQ